MNCLSLPIYFMIASAVSATPIQAAEPTLSPDHFEYKMISSPPNMPGGNIGSRSSKGLLIAAHQGVARARLAALVRVSEPEASGRIAQLKEEGLLGESPAGRLRPRFPIITVDDAHTSFAVDWRLADRSARAIERRLPAIKSAYAELPGFRHVPFQRASLFVLSNVLLDNWQIANVEHDLLNAPRPRRTGGNYYLALLETAAKDGVEPFGIYGNQGVGLGDISANIYGNRRYSDSPTLHNLTSKMLAERYGYPIGVNAAEVSRGLARTLVAKWSDPRTAVGDREAALLRSMGLISTTGKLLVPIVGPRDQEGLDFIAESFRPTLVGLLRDAQPALRRQYDRSGYADEGVSFEEYFIWWYHFYYTAVTDRLVRRGVITLPRSSNSTVLNVRA